MNLHIDATVDMPLTYYCNDFVPLNLREILAGDIPVGVPGHRLGHDEGEDASLVAVVQTKEAVQKSHLDSDPMGLWKLGKKTNEHGWQKN